MNIWGCEDDEGGEDGWRLKLLETFLQQPTRPDYMPFIHYDR